MQLYSKMLLRKLEQDAKTLRAGGYAKDAEIAEACAKEIAARLGK